MRLNVGARILVLLSAWLTVAQQPASPRSAADPVIAAAGDIACPPGQGVTATQCHHQNTSTILASRPLDAVLALGDNQYPDGQLADYNASYHPTWGRFRAITHPTPGNHEYQTDPSASGYFNYFGDAAGEPTKGYYSFGLGSWHVISLNSNCERVGGCHRGSPQELWLRADLATHQSACTLAYWHHPRFTSGSSVHQSDPRTAAFWQALYEFRADVILSGHQHSYERFGPQAPDGSPDPSNGIRQFVVGTGGRSLYDFGPTPAPNSAVRNDDTFGVLELTLRSTSYGWEFLPEAGKSFTDSGSASCVGLPGSPEAGEVKGKTVVIKVKPRRVVAGRRTVLAATVFPCQGNEGDPVRFQRRRDQAWRTVATVVSNQTCTATVDRKIKRTTRFRAVSDAEGDYHSGISNVVKVSVRPRSAAG